MRKTKNISMVILAIVLVCSFTVAVYAYSSSATAQVYPTGDNDIYFHANNNSDADPSAIKYISHYAESAWMGAVLASADYYDDQHRYNSLNSYYTETNAADGTYTEYVEGYTEYMPPITYTDHPTDSASYYKGARLSTLNSNELTDVKVFLDELDKTIAKAFEVDLSSYRKIDTLNGFMTPEYYELRLLDVRMQIPLKYGDTIPSIYLNKDNTQGIAFTQDLQGVYTLYEFEANKDKESRFKWTITGTKTVQGEYKAVNENVKEYFKKNPNPPTYKYESTGSKLTITITR